MATFLLLVAACSPVTPAATAVSSTTVAPSPKAPSATVGPGSRATFVHARATGLDALDADCHTLGHVVELPEQTYTGTIGLSPDRTRVAFNLTSATPGGGFGSDIYEVRLDGSDLRAVVKRESENIFYDSPRYDPTAQFLYVHRRSPIIASGTQTGLDDSIERIDLKSGQHTVVVRDGEGATVSPDGKTIVYVHLKDAFPDALWVATLPDAVDAHPLLKTSDAFFYLQSPQFSSSGTRIAFSGAGRRASRGSSGGRLAHLGVPSQLYLVDADGTHLDQLTDTADDVVPAWSPDDTRIAYVGLGSLGIITLAGRSTTVCGKGDAFVSGSIVWAR